MIFDAFSNLFGVVGLEFGSFLTFSTTSFFWFSLLLPLVEVGIVTDLLISEVDASDVLVTDNDDVVTSDDDDDDDGWFVDFDAFLEEIQLK